MLGMLGLQQKFVCLQQECGLLFVVFEAHSRINSFSHRIMKEMLHLEHFNFLFEILKRFADRMQRRAATNLASLGEKGPKLSAADMCCL